VQSLIVYIIVAAAALTAAWQFMPQFMRRWLVRRLAAIAPSQRGLLERLEAKAERSGCSSCKGCSYSGEKTTASRQVTIEIDRR
jgi:hypothetical protein